MQFDHVEIRANAGPMEKLSAVRYAIREMDSNQLKALVDSLPARTETRQAIERLKKIKDVGNVVALEVLLQMFGKILNDNQDIGAPPTHPHVKRPPG